MKAEIKNVFVDKDRVQSVQVSLEPKGIKVLPLGDTRELLPGIYYKEIENMTTVSIQNPLTDNSTEVIGNKCEPTYIYMDEEHKYLSDKAKELEAKLGRYLTVEEREELFDTLRKEM